MGTQISSVVPGYTVDSSITTDPFFKNLDTVLVAFISGIKFGFLFFLLVLEQLL